MLKMYYYTRLSLIKNISICNSKQPIKKTQFIELNNKYKKGLLNEIT